MTPIARFATLDDAESALDWIGLDFVDGDDAFEGQLDGDDRDLLATAIEDPETPSPIADLARALRSAWDASGTPTLPFSVTWGG